MQLIKKYHLYFFGFGIVLLFFVTRLYNILSLPIFTDEAIYVRWAQVAANDAQWRFISLTDGKQPMFVWIAMLLIKLFKDPLFAGRFVSVLAGFGSVIGLFFLSREIFRNTKIGLVTSLMYVLFPFALVYDRLALYDSIVAFFIIWALYFEVLLIRLRRLDIALILGMILGGGMLTKTSNNFALILLPLSVLLYDFKKSPLILIQSLSIKSEWIKNLLKWFSLVIIAIIVAFAMYSVLRLSPFYHIIGQKNITFVYPLSEWIMSPFSYFVGNFKGLTSWLFGYVTIPFLILSLASFVVEKKYFREKLFLLIWFLAPFMALALFGKVIYPRFILFMTMPLLVLGAYTLYHAVVRTRKFYLKVLVAFVFLISFLINDFLILTNFEKAKIPSSEREQFFTGWPSGVGVKETIKFLEEKSKNEKIYVGTEGTFGLMPYALEIYLKDNPNVKTEGFWPINETLPKAALESAKSVPTYFVFYQPCPSCVKSGVAPATWPVEKVFQISRPETDSFYTLYKIRPQ